ncbi:MAG: 3-isopropylmalate dehydratase small subunit [Deltaproteobacteria bacterium]|nr:3-isopropylmalate dehydratase small subunit [Deltaproteobacteria bacterium]
MKTFGGKVLFLDRSDINTDEIIPAKYLTEVKKEALGPHMLEDLKLDGFDPLGDKTQNASVIVTRANFGCGSSREHAPWALEVNGITLVIANNYARIFRQNMFNCGMLAIELGEDEIDTIFKMAALDVECSVDIDQKMLTFKSSGQTQTIPFTVAPFDEALVRAGGWVEYADQNL